MTNFVVQSKMNNLLDIEIVDPNLPDQDLPTRRDPIDLETLGFKVLDEPVEVAPGLTLYATGPDPAQRQINIPFNQNAAITTRANTLRTGGGLGLNLTGAGITVGVWDEGAVRSTHQELNGRVAVVDAAPLSAHATHVAGTIGATGIVPALGGMASGVNIRSRDWNSDFTELNADAGAGLIQISNHSYGFLTGWLGQLATAAPLLNTPTDFWYENRANFSEEDPDFGRYSSETRQLDEVLYNNPALLSVWAAGNHGDDQFTNANPGKYLAFLSGPTVGGTLIAPAIYLIDVNQSGLTPPPPDGNGGAGYDSLPSVQTAKNSLVVGAISNTTWNGDNTIATGGTVLPISSWGATDDGRMKPDLVASGDNIISSLSANNTASGSLFGDTSSSAASVTGTMVLLYEHHQNLDGLNDPEYENVQNKTGTPTNPRFKTIADPLSSTMKGLGIHTATDIGLTGPDYQSGWGLLNGQSAATFLSDLGDPYQDNPSLLVEDTFDGSPIDIGTVNSNGGEIKVTLVWTDPAPTTLPTRGTNDGNIDDPTSVLVNDLDLYLKDSNGTIYYPWTLDPSNPSLGAVKTTANNRENVEQVVFNATTEGIGAGDYTVYVDGVLDPGYADQDFSIFFSSVPQFGNGHGWGDVHLVTFDGRKYDFQSVGEFILIESTVDNWQVQTRQEPWKNRTDVSVNTAFATKMDGFKVVYDLDRPDGEKLTIEGTTIQIASGQSQTLSASIIERQDNVYTFTWAGLDGTIGTADDDRITARDQGDHINIYVDPADYRTTFVRGLLGNGNGNVADDFTLRDGTLLSENPTAVKIHTKWADSWRITQEESLFGTKTFSDPNFPENLITIDDLPPEVREKALRTARKAGIPEDFVEEAAFDFVVTGERNFIESAAETFIDKDTNPNNRPPVAVDDNFITEENQPLNGNVLVDNGNGTDSDPDQDTLIVIDNTNPQNGTVNINPQGAFSYAPNQDFSGEDSFEYTISDNRGGTSTAMVNITVNQKNPYVDGDFNGDGITDLLWKNELDLNGSSIFTISYLDPDFDDHYFYLDIDDRYIECVEEYFIINRKGQIVILDKNWNVIKGNLVGTPQVDLLLQDKISGSLTIWEMKENRVVGNHPITYANGKKVKLNSDWDIFTGNFVGTNDDDLLLRNKINGNLSLWEMNDNQIVEIYPIIKADGKKVKLNSDWDIFTGNFVGTNDDDLLLRNKINGNLSLGEMNDNQIVEIYPIIDAKGNKVKLMQDWQITTGHFTGNNQDDLILRNNDSGTLAFWEMENNQIVGINSFSDSTTVNRSLVNGTLGTADDDRITARDRADQINIDVDPADYRTTFVPGLLGNGNGNVADDFTLRDGTLLSENPTALEIHTTWADSWRITQQESLFDTKTFFDPNFPKPLLTKDDLDPIESAAETLIDEDVDGDFNGDGITDLLWKNESDNGSSIFTINYFDDDDYIECMKKDFLIKRKGKIVILDGNWNVIKGNFVGTPQVDLLLQHKISGSLTIWEMEENRVVDNHPIIDASNNNGVQLNSDWDIFTGNFVGTNDDDLLLRNKINGNLSLREMNDNQVVQIYPIIDASNNEVQLNSDWDIFTGNFVGTNDDDLFLRNKINGDLSLWEMNDNQVVQIYPIIDADNNQVQLMQDRQITTGNFTGNNQDDLILRNNDSGTLDFWEMNDNQIVQINSFPDSTTVNRSLVI